MFYFPQVIIIIIIIIIIIMQCKYFKNSKVTATNYALLNNKTIICRSNTIYKLYPTDTSLFYCSNITTQRDKLH